MDPLEEEKQALLQQEEFESRLFSDTNYAVIACARITKNEKQYVLVLTVCKSDNKDCKLHLIRIKNSGILVIEKSIKIYKVKSIEIADKDSISWDFKLTWKNAFNSNECFMLSPNTLRSAHLFAFFIYHVSIHCCAHEISIKPLKLCDLELNAYTQWLHKIFTNNFLFRRINQIQRDIFTPIYTRLTYKNSNINESGRKRTLSMRKIQEDIPNDKPFLITDEETKTIETYMEICNVSFDNTHLLESRLLEMQRDLMHESINIFQTNEKQLDNVIDNIDSSIQSVAQMQNDFSHYKHYINKMSIGMNQIKKKNNFLTQQENHYHDINNELTDIISKLTLHPKYEQVLKNPFFKSDMDYKRALEAANILSQKLSLPLNEDIKSMQAVRSQNYHFKILNETFCCEATQFFIKLFENKAKSKSKYVSEKCISSHTNIHAMLLKYDELLKHISTFYHNKLNEIRCCYERVFSKVYINQFKSYFNWIKTTINSDEYEQRMCDLPTINLFDIMDNDTESTCSSMFIKPTSKIRVKTYNDCETNNSHKITYIYKQCLSEIIPIIIVEQQIMEKYLFYNINSKDCVNNIDIILESMFGCLENEFGELIDVADSINCFNTLEMLIISERSMHTYGNGKYNSFLGCLLTKLYEKLVLNWNRFVSQEINWIKSQEINIKKAGVLLPMQKLPAFCNEMLRAISFGHIKSNEFTNMDKLLYCFEEKEEVLPMDNIMMIFPESERVTNTVHKLTHSLFQWLEQNIQKQKKKIREKYKHICLAENYYYFYNIFSKTESLQAIYSHILKAKTRYNKQRKLYVGWSVRYHCKELFEFLDDFEHKMIENHIEIMTVYIINSSQKLKTICNKYLDTEIQIDQIINGMFDRLKRHLGENDILFREIWRNIAQYFCSKYKTFKQNIELLYENNENKFLRYSMEFIWNRFYDKYQDAFDNSSYATGSTAKTSSYYSSNNVSKAKKRLSKFKLSLKSKSSKSASNSRD
eukprot:429819_1